MKRENISCRPGTTDAMERLAAENEALRVERDGFASKLAKLSKAIPRTIRQYRHNDDCSPNLLEPEQGFVIAYEREAVDRILAETPAQSLANIKAAGAREALQRAMQTPGFSDTVVRVDALKAAIADMESES